MDTSVDLDQLWDFDQPAVSEARFRAALASDAVSTDTALVLRTQLARALGLQGRFEDATAELATVAAAVTAASPLVRCHLELERGRVLRSSAAAAHAEKGADTDATGDDDGGDTTHVEAGTADNAGGSTGSPGDDTTYVEAGTASNAGDSPGSIDGTGNDAAGAVLGTSADDAGISTNAGTDDTADNGAGVGAGSAAAHFTLALDLATEAGIDHLAVDAAHMLAITLDGEEQIPMAQRALAIAEASSDPRARKWVASVTHNLGWTMHDLGRHEEALTLWEKALAARLERAAADPASAQREAEPVRIARWTVARGLRSVGRYAEALAIQRALAAEGPPDPYVDEELAELTNHPH